MNSFVEKTNLHGFSVENIDTSFLDEVSDWLPKNGAFDLNIAEEGLVLTLHAQNFCQEQIVKLDRWIGYKEAARSKAWAAAALDKAKANGHTSVKNREWFAQADEDYIKANNDLVFAKACNRYFENKADHFSGWHYAFKTFLKRDYSLERLGNFQSGGYNNSSEFRSSGHGASSDEDVEICGDIEWK
jgi:hypothetical protein